MGELAFGAGSPVASAAFAMQPRPARVVHCDWSKDEGKRWCATARFESHSRYRVDVPEPVGPLDTFFNRLRVPGEPVLVGFDFPIGLPSRYAEAAGILDFRAALCEFGRGRWQDFYNPAEEPGDVSLRRPFYAPPKGEKQKQKYLVEGLRVPMNDLYRRCDDRPGRRKAASLFWCVGGNQVGKAAITGWRDLIAPDLDGLAIWPFDGDLATLRGRPGIVVAETYPGEVYHQLGLKIVERDRSKRRASDRAKDAGTLLCWARKNDVDVTDRLRREIEDGFLDTKYGKDGDDPFDALVGLFGMLDVVLGNRRDGAPADDRTRIEGWILGQSPSAAV